jgi:hypothetical protein
VGRSTQRRVIKAPQPAQDDSHGRPTREDHPNMRRFNADLLRSMAQQDHAPPLAIPRADAL